MGNSHSQQRLRNRGGSYVENYEVHRAHSGGHLLRLRGPIGAVKQVGLTDPTYSVLETVDIPAGQQQLRGTRPAPTDTTSALLELLHDVLTLPCADNVDFALALDWYKTPVDGLSSREWPNTATADLVHRGKFWYSKHPRDAAKQRECGLALVDLLLAVVAKHPLLKGVDRVVAVPGHDSKRLSFGARLASAVAKQLGKPLVRCTALTEFRTEAKSVDLDVRASMLAGQFICSDNLTNLSLMIVDDTYGSGATVAETARALRAAGAVNVASLCAVRTMRS